jgi:hypothetical protein
VVQEHVAVRTLAGTLVPGRPRPWDEALRLVGAVGRALQQLHAAGLVHGAVTPGNVLLPDAGVPRLARASPEGFEREPLYLSPEQAVGERVDARADIFALGALTYRLVTGCDAFEAETAQKVLARVTHDQPRPPSQLVPGLPPGVDDVVGQALAKARKDRYADVGAFCDDVDELLAGRPPRHARKETPRDTGPFLETAPAPERGDSNVTSPPEKRRRSTTRLAAGVAALALVAGLELLRQKLEAPDTAPAGRPSVEQHRRESVRAAPDPIELPSLVAPEPARLAFELRHTLERATLVVTIDGTTVLERRVSAAVKTSLFGIKLREGRARDVIELPPGRRRIAVSVAWGDDRRSETIAGDFAAGASRRLTANLARVGKRLSVELE